MTMFGVILASTRELWLATIQTFSMKFFTMDKLFYLLQLLFMNLATTCVCTVYTNKQKMKYVVECGTIQSHKHAFVTQLT